MLRCGPEAGSGGGGVCWGAQSTSGPTKTEMLNGPFPKVKVEISASCVVLFCGCLLM